MTAIPFTGMIDKTLARMIDETLQMCRNSFASGVRKMLEVRANRPHLLTLPALFAVPAIVQDFVRELFTIKRVPVVAEAS